MARLLVIAKDNDRQGEVIDIRPDGFAFGKKEKPPTFEIIDLPGVPPEKLKDLTEPDMVTDEAGKLVQRARRKVRVSDVSLAKRDTTEAQIRARLEAYPKDAGTKEGREKLEAAKIGER